MQGCGPVFSIQRRENNWVAASKLAYQGRVAFISLGHNLVFLWMHALFNVKLFI